MGEIINLNRARKARNRAEKEARAEANRIAFGRTKAEKLASRLERDRQDAELDGKKLDDPA